MSADNRSDRVLRGIRSPMRSGTLAGRLSEGDGPAEMLDVDDVIAFLGFTFLNLGDTPSSYSGQAAQIVRVNASADGLEFADPVPTVFDWKDSVRMASTANVTLSGLQTIDGVVGVADDRVLLKDQSTASENGLYEQKVGSWVRTSDADADAEVTSGLAVVVEEGTANISKLFILTTPDPITVGSTSLTFTELSGGASDYDGLTDTPSTMVGQALKEIRVNAGETAHEYFVAPAVGATVANALHVRDEKTTGTNGGSSSAATLHTRTLNTVVTNTITGASLSSNQITLPAGTYDIWASAPYFQNKRNRAQLYNTTDAAIELIGTSGEHANLSDFEGGAAIIRGQITITGTKVFELRHYTESAIASTGLGLASSDGNTEVFGDVFIRKVVGTTGNATELNDIDDVNAPSPADNDFIQWDTGTSKWINFDLFGATNTWGGVNTFSAQIVSDDTTDSSSPTTGAIQTDGGLGVAKDARIGTGLRVGTGTITAPLGAGAPKAFVRGGIAAQRLSGSDGQMAYMTMDGGLASFVSRNASNVTHAVLRLVQEFLDGTQRVVLNFDTAGLASFFSGLAITDTTDSSSPTTGSIQTAGGLGVEKDVRVGNGLRVATGTITAPLGEGAPTIFAKGGVAAQRLSGSDGQMAYMTMDQGTGAFVSRAASNVTYSPLELIQEFLDGTQQMSLAFNSAGNAAFFNNVALPGALTVGSPTGGVKSAGDINAQAVYDDNVLLTCYPLEAYLDGAIDIGAWDARVHNRQHARTIKNIKVPLSDGSMAEEEVTDKPAWEEVRSHGPAAAFAADAERRLNPKTFYEDMVARRALPGMPTKDEWAENGPSSMGEIVQTLWEALETVVIHGHERDMLIEELLERIETLEAE